MTLERSLFFGVCFLIYEMDSSSCFLRDGTGANEIMYESIVNCWHPEV